MKTADIYKEITEQFISSLEQKQPPWLAPWAKPGMTMDIPYNFTTGEQYHGINVLRFWLRQLEQNYTAPAYATVKQANALGCRVKRLEGFTPPPDKPHATGQRAMLGIRVGTTVKEVGEDEKEAYSWLKTFYVLNADQYEIPEELRQKLPLPGQFNATPSRFRDLLSEMRVRVVSGSYRCPFYRGGGVDTIYMPDTFKTKEDEEASLAHELIHWTGHKNRLNRFEEGDEEFGETAKEKYAFEELVAEIGASFLCVRFGMKREGLQHEAYIASWIKCLKNDSRAVVKAAARAQVAVDYLMKEMLDAKAA